MTVISARVPRRMIGPQQPAPGDHVEMPIVLAEEAGEMLEAPFDDIVERPDLAAVGMAGKHQVDACIARG